MRKTKTVRKNAYMQVSEAKGWYIIQRFFSFVFLILWSLSWDRNYDHGIRKDTKKIPKINNIFVFKSTQIEFHHGEVYGYLNHNESYWCKAASLCE